MSPVITKVKPKKKLPVVKSDYKYKKVADDDKQDFSDFSKRSLCWASDLAFENYDVMIQPQESNATVFCPLPIFDAEDPARFAPVRDDDEPVYLGQWALPVHIVKRAGSSFRSAVSFCPYPTFQADANQDQSPYIVLRENLRQWMKANKPEYLSNKNVKDPSIWLRLFNRWTDPTENNSFASGPIFPSHDLMRLVLCVLIAGTERVYDKEAKRANKVYRKYYDANNGLFGKGVTGDDDKLTLLAISSQVWNDFSSKINASTATGGFAYPDPVDPENPAVWYTWTVGSAAPYTGAIGNDKSQMGSTGCIDITYKTQVSSKGIPIKYPNSLVDPDGSPSEYYYSKATLHLYDCVKILTEREQVMLIAAAYPNARYLFEIGWKNTDFSHYLEDPEFNRQFDNVEQLWVDENSISQTVITLPSKNQPVEEEEEFDGTLESYEAPSVVLPKAKAESRASSTPAVAKKTVKSDKYDQPLPNEEVSEFEPLDDDGLEEISSDGAEEETEEIEIKAGEDKEGWAIDLSNNEYILDDEGNRQKFDANGDLYTPPPVVLKKPVKKIVKRAV